MQRTELFLRVVLMRPTCSRSLKKPPLIDRRMSMSDWAQLQYLLFSEDHLCYLRREEWRPCELESQLTDSAWNWRLDNMIVLRCEWSLCYKHCLYLLQLRHLFAILLPVRWLVKTLYGCEISIEEKMKNLRRKKGNHIKKNCSMHLWHNRTNAKNR